MMDETKGINQRAKEYLILIYNGKKVMEHRFIWEINNGKIPKDYMIHHINGIKTDNRIENLECVDRTTHGLKHRKNNHKATLPATQNNS